MSSNQPISSTTLVVHVVDHFAMAEVEQGRKLCPGRCSAPSVPFVTSAESVHTKKKRKRRCNREITANTIDKKTDRESAALAHVHTQLVQRDANLSESHSSIGTLHESHNLQGLLSRVHNTCNARCTNAARTFADDTSAIKEWTDLVKLAGFAGSNVALVGGAVYLSPLDLGATWAASTSHTGFASASGGDCRKYIEQKGGPMVEVDDGELLGRLIELPGSPYSAPINDGLHVRASSGGIKWWQPVGSSFVLGDLLAKGAPALAPLLRHNRQFEIITMDPPWPSKSVNRAKTYSTLPGSRKPHHESKERKCAHGAMTDGGPTIDGASSREGGASDAPTLAASAAAASVAAASAAAASAASPAELAALMRLRVERLADRERGCLVGVWVTNCRSLIDSVQQCFLPSLGALPLNASAASPMEFTRSHDHDAAGEHDGDGGDVTSDLRTIDGDTNTLDGSILYWIKVAANGEPVFPLVRREDAGCGGRRPFEKMVLGWIPPSAHSTDRMPSCHHSTNDDKSKKRKNAPDASTEDPSPTPANASSDPATHVVVSVGPLRHSWKPPLTAILDDILKSCQAHDGIQCDASTASCEQTSSRSGQPESDSASNNRIAGSSGAIAGSQKSNTRRLELFARELRPGWASVGNEALLFQQDTFFETPAT